MVSSDHVHLSRLIMRHLNSRYDMRCENLELKDTDHAHSSGLACHSTASAVGGGEGGERVVVEH